MSREQERIRKKLENNPIAECNRIQNRFCPGLFSMFGSVKDPRHQSYIDYSARVMLGTMYYKSIAGISSMQEMTRTFNDERICRNLYRIMGEHEKDYMPHGVTENEFLERLNPKELEDIQQNIVYSMIRRKTFDNARVLKKWQVIVDATELDEGYQKKNEHYLSRCYNRGEDNEYLKYHRSVLEAKICFGENLVCYDYSDIANACGYAYAKCFSEIEKKYVNSQDKYYNLDGTPCTKKQEIAWLDEAYEEKINWETANVRIAAGREQFLGHIPDISQKDIEEYEENIKNAKEQYIKQYQEKGTVKLQHLSFGQSSLLQKLSELMNM